MKIEKNKLVKVFWKSPRFSNKLKINGTKGIILDSIKVVECERGISNFPYYISVEDNGDILITPIGTHGVYFVTAERAINADVLEIKAEDYIQDYATMNGSLKQLEVVITVDLKHYVAHTELMLNRRISI